MLSEAKIKESDSFELTREDIISKDAEITRLQEFSHSSSKSSLNIAKEAAITDDKKDELETLKTKDDHPETCVIESIKMPTPSIPTIHVIASHELPAKDDPLPTTQPKRPVPPKIPPLPSGNQDKITSSTSTTESPIINEPPLELKDDVKVHSQPVAPPRKKRQQKKVLYKVYFICISC